jgi:hypothetical protein
MTTSLHGLWGATIAGFKYQKPKPYLLGFVIGTLPDLLGAVPVTYFRRILQTDINDIPAWTLIIYHSTHSLLTASLVFLLIYKINKNYLWLGLPYLWHIIFDILWHCEPIGTQVFFPLSGWSFCGPFFSPEKLTAFQAFLTIPGNLAYEGIQYLALIPLNIWLAVNIFKKTKSF